MIATARRGALCALAALALMMPAAAHADPVTPVTPSDSTSRAVATQGPTVAAAAVAVRARAEAAPDDATAMQSRMGLGRSRALMFVGLATLITGAIIGGDAGTIIMIAGAGMGLYGLYQYLQ